MSLDNQIETQIQSASETQLALNNFWPSVTEEIKGITHAELRQQELPLARIKRIMKLDEDVKMISAEAPALFSKAAEIFINELTLRAWIHTEDNKRRTLQKNDIAMAITKYDQFDFLIDIVPREEIISSSKTKEESRATISADQQYFQIAQQYQAVLQQSSTNTSTQTNTIQTSAQPQTIQIVQTTGGVPTVQTSPTSTQSSPQVIQIHTQPQAPQQAQTQSQQPGGGIQIIQQIIGPNGQIQQIPIQLTQEQLQMIKLQMSGACQQPVVIHTTPIQAVSQSGNNQDANQPQVIHLQQN